MKMLLTGFEPFGESPINPSQELVRALADSDFSSITLIKAVLPVDQTAAPEKMAALIKQHRPDAILAFGLATGMTKISLERLAINLKDFRIPDNTGATVVEQPIDQNGPTAYFTTLPIRSMLNTLLEAGIPAEISLTAGAYLCNLVFYVMMHILPSLEMNIPAGFIHLPALPVQAAAENKPVPSLSLEVDIQAARILISLLGSKPS